MRTSPEPPFVPHTLSPLSRRRLFVSAAAAVALGGLVRGLSALAQEAGTPEVEDSAVSPETPEATPEAVGPTVPPEFTSDETNWPVEGGNLSQTRQARGTAISSETVGELGLAWSFPVTATAAFGGLTANPIVVGDTVYLQDATSNVYAIDKATGAEKWTKVYDRVVPSGGPNGVAVGYGLVVYPVGVGEVVAVDAETGDDVWTVDITGPLGEGITTAPLIYDGTVYISTIPGTDDAFYVGGMRGLIHALDIRDGSVIWYFDTTTDNLWGNARVNSGGGFWHPPSVDEAGNLYVGIGNAAPWPGTEEFPSATSRPGDNDYANSLIRIDPRTVGVDWYINVKPHDPFDHDNQLSPILATVTIDGAETPAVFSSGKHGWVVAANAETGEELWRTPVGQHNENEFAQELPADDETPLEVLPGALGGVETPMAYADGVLYAPAVNLAFTFTGSTVDIVGGDLFSGTSELVALDAATGAILWSVEAPTLLLGGATVANDVVFTGGLDGVIRGYRVDDGTRIFAHQAASGIASSFAVSGDYLFVPAGGIFSPSPDTVEPAPEASQELIALKIGGETQATPAAG